MRTLCESIEEYLLLEMVNHHLGSFLLLWADVAAGKVLLIVTFDWVPLDFATAAAHDPSPPRPNITTFKTAYFGQIRKKLCPSS